MDRTRLFTVYTLDNRIVHFVCGKYEVYKRQMFMIVSQQIRYIVVAEIFFIHITAKNNNKLHFCLFVRQRSSIGGEETILQCYSGGAVIADIHLFIPVASHNQQYYDMGNHGSALRWFSHCIFGAVIADSNTVFGTT